MSFWHSLFLCVCVCVFNLKQQNEPVVLGREPGKLGAMHVGTATVHHHGPSAVMSLFD